ncbi:BolA family transcriptional regulator [Myxococcota bacterium]|nr:BolA family transcriptional regulator [Myxococcota bacterium]
MSGHHPTNFQGDIFAAITAAIEAAIPGAKVSVAGGGGHFEIQVISKSFEGQRTLQKHKAVLGAIAHLMQGDGAPVHAVDRIDARTE